MTGGDDKQTNGQRCRAIVVPVLVYLLCLAGCAVGGYVIGSSSSPDQSEATNERRAGFKEAYGVAKTAAFQRSKAAGKIRGLKAGRVSAKQDGARRGSAEGERNADTELASIATAEAEAAARAEAEERAANCGAPLFVDGYCPTDAEIEQENEAEAHAGLGE